MAVLKPAPGVLGGVSLLTAIEFICLVHLIICLVFVCSASSTTSVDVAGVRVSGFFQCVNAAWFLLGIPLIIIGGVGAVFRVDKQLQAYLVYLWATLFVAIAWLFIFLRYGNACNTIQPLSGKYKKQALMVCQASNGMAIFWMLVVTGVLLGSIYLVWSMIQYVKERHVTELLRYQEPWEAVTMLSDDSAENLAKERRNLQQMKEQHFFDPRYALAPTNFNPYEVHQVPNQFQPYGALGGRGGSRGVC
jgi:hypothetical protein